MRRLLAAGACALVLGGCVTASEETGRQLDEVGDVEVETVVCASSLTGCDFGNSGQPAGSGDYQLLVAYRIPGSVTPPESVAGGEGTLVLTRNAGFAAELERLAAAPPEARQKWVGYVSAPFAYQAVGGRQSIPLTARFALVRGSDGRPWAGPFLYRSILGYRDAGPDPARPVDCGDALAEGTADTLCQDWPRRRELPENEAVATRDVSILPGAAAEAARGATATVPFTVAYEGEGRAPSFALSTETTVPGATTRPAEPTVAPPAAGTVTVPVVVVVPGSAPAGDYDVRLTARLANGQTRTSTGRLRVTGSDGPDRRPPDVAIGLIRRQTVERIRKVGMKVEVTCSEPCAVAARLRLSRRTATRLGVRRVVARGSWRHAPAGRRTVRVRFVGGSGPRLARPRRVRATLRVAVRDAVGNRRVRTLAVRLRRR